MILAMALIIAARRGRSPRIRLRRSRRARWFTSPNIGMRT